MLKGRGNPVERQLTSTGPRGRGGSWGRGVRVGGGGRVWGWVRVGSGFRTRSRGGHVETPPLMPLHVPHTSEGLDERCCGSPVVPVLVIAVLKHILAPPVARIHVSHPPSESKRRRTISVWCI